MRTERERERERERELRSVMVEREFQPPYEVGESDGGTPHLAVRPVERPNLC
jgi:hypothetical protein